MTQQEQSIEMANVTRVLASVYGGTHEEKPVIETPSAPITTTEAVVTEPRLNVSIMQPVLVAALKRVSRAISKRTVLPVLSNVRLATVDAGVELYATNLELAIKTWVPARIQTDGVITLPAKLLLDFVSSMPKDERVDLIEDDENRVAVRSGSGLMSTTLRGIDADEYPSVTDTPDVAPLTVTEGELKRALGQIVYAAASDQARPILTGVLTTFEGRELKLIACDNWRIATKIVTRDPSAVGQPFSLVIPATAMTELLRLLTDSDKLTVDIRPHESHNQVFFTAESFLFLSRTIDGQYPNYEQVIPARHTTAATVDRHELLALLKLAGLSAAEKANVVLIAADADAHTVTVTAKASPFDDSSSAGGSIEGTVEGNSVEVGFNVNYIRDAIAVMSTDRVSIELSGPLAPGVVKPVGDDSYLAVVMPVRVSS